MTDTRDPSGDTLHALGGATYVAQYLHEHPEFFRQHPELLSQLEVPHEAGAISLVERQVKVLRERLRELQGQMIEMLRNARENERLLAQCFQLCMRLIGCTDLQTMHEQLRQSLQLDFHADAEALLFSERVPVAAPLRQASAEQIRHALHCGFPDAEPVCGALDNDMRTFLFGELRPELRSVALVPIGVGARDGLLAIASRDAAHFTPAMGTMFLTLIGQLLARMVAPHVFLADDH